MTLLTTVGNWLAFLLSARSVSVSQFFAWAWTETGEANNHRVFAWLCAMSTLTFLLLEKYVHAVTRRKASKHFVYIVCQLPALYKTFNCLDHMLEQSCKRASFWSPNPALARHIFLRPRLGSKTKFAEWVKICATVGYWWRSKLNTTK